MYQYFDKLDVSIKHRYITIEKNIKSKSNSFYDSYLDLLEATFKIIFDSYGVPYDSSKTCGFFIKDLVVKNFLINDFNITEEQFNKINDHIKKCNDHKHKKEKWVSLDAVINFLRSYFELISAYYQKLDISTKVIFEEGYFVEIFGLVEKQNNSYKEEITILKKEIEELIVSKKISENDLKVYFELQSISEIEKYELENQNQTLQKQIMTLQEIKLRALENKLDKIISALEDKVITNETLSKSANRNPNDRNIMNFIRNSHKRFIWHGNKYDSESYKSSFTYICLASLFCGILGTILISFSYGFYTTFSLFENILLISIIIRTIKVKNTGKLMNQNDVSEKSIYSYRVIPNFMIYQSTGKMKTKHKVILTLAIISFILNCIYISLAPTNVMLYIFGIIFNSIFIVLSIYFYYKSCKYYQLYHLIIMNGKISIESQEFSIVYDCLINVFYSYEEFDKKYKKYL